MKKEDVGSRRAMRSALRCVLVVAAAVVLMQNKPAAQAFCLDCVALEAACTAQGGTTLTASCGQGQAFVVCIGSPNQGPFSGSCLSQGGTANQTGALETCFRLCP